MCNERLTPDELTIEQTEKVVHFEIQTSLKVLELIRQEDGQIRPTLINGRQVDRDDWREVVRIGNRSCTGTLVGRNAAITAAHCGRHNSRSRLEVFREGQLQGFNYRMVHMPQYRGGSSFDLAVLALDNEVTGVNYAIAGVDYTFRQGSPVDILGYGCTRPGGGGGNDGILRFGESLVRGFTGTDVITQHRPSGAALCFGDSGGPMMADKSDQSTTDHNTLIAVNSKGNIRDTNYNMRLDLDSVREFLESVADRFDLEIYGVNASPTPPDPQPDPDPQPEPPEPNVVWAQLSKQHRETAQYYEQLALKYDQLGSENPPSPPGETNGDSFGL